MMQTKLKVHRNAPCPCGSGLKYKKCCMGKALGQVLDLKEHYWQEYRIRLKTPRDVEGIRAAGRVAMTLLDRIEPMIRPGLTTNEIDRLVVDITESHGATSAPLNYEGFPRSVCVSVNEVVCHGIPSDRILADGDIVNVDVTPILDGYHADASKTFLVGTPSPEAVRLVSIARQCLRVGIAEVRPDNTVGDIGWAIQTYAEGHGCSVVRDYVGHGVGVKFHEAPQIPHFGKKGQGVTLVPGMVFTIEPMINLGTHEVRLLDDQWTVVTADGALSAQFEQTVLVTPTSCEILTPYD